VQGVFYRQRTKREAERLGICGRVNNNSDGTVNVVATGERTQLDALIDWCKKGPPRARVESVTVSKMDVQEFDRFAVVYK
jgi:acylphosphatase